MRFVTRKVVSASLLVLGALALFLLAVTDWAGRLEVLSHAVDGTRDVAKFIADQPIVAMTVLLFGLGVFLATDIRLPPLWRAIQGQIGLRFEPREPWVRNHPTSNIQFSDGTVANPPVRFFRAELVAPYQGIAKECRVFLLNVERLQDGAFVETAYDGTQPLRWANTTDDIFGHRDATASRRAFFDVLSVDAFYSAVKVKWPTPDWYAYQDLFVSPGVYRITLSAVSANCGEAQLALILLWTGQWDQTEMLREDTADLRLLSARLPTAAS